MHVACVARREHGATDRNPLVENVKKRANSMSASILQLLLEGLPACRDLLLLPVVYVVARKEDAADKNRHV